MRSHLLAASVFFGQLLVVVPALADDPNAAQPPTGSPTTTADGAPASSGATEEPPPVRAKESLSLQPPPANDASAGRATEPAPARAADADEPAGRTKASNEEDNAKKVGIGVDAAAIVPVGEYSDRTGPILGGTVRLGYDVTPRFQAFVRGGYQFGTAKEVTVVTGVKAQAFTYAQATIRLDVIPVYVGGRYFAMKPRSGLYGDLELGMNIFKRHTSMSSVVSSEARIGANLGVGYVISEEFPLNVGAQLSYLNMLGADTNEKAFIGLNFQLGYELRF